MAWRPHLRSVLLLVNILILALPLGGIAILRLYESELIKRTESELIAQGAVLSAAYRAEVMQILRDKQNRNPTQGNAAPYGSPAEPRWLVRSDPNSPLDPFPPKLDMAKDRVLKPAKRAHVSHVPSDRIAAEAAERIEPIMRRAGRVTLAGIRIIDFRGTVVASTGSESGLSVTAREEVRRALKGERVSLLRQRYPDRPTPSLESISRGTRVRVFVALPVLLDDRVIGAVLLSRTPLDIRKALYLNRHLLIGGGLIIIAVVVLVSLVTSLTISRPVSALIGQAEQVAQGEQNAAIPLKKPGTYEVDQLSKALADMSVMLEERADYIRTFASNVSHEFKTPLTSMRGTIELLRDHIDDMPRENRDRFLEMLDEDTTRLDRLVRRLLELARADVFRPGNERADVREVLDLVVRRYSEWGLPVEIRHDPTVSAVRMAPETFDSIVANFLDNARQHGGDRVAVTLVTRLAGTRESPLVELTIQDTGQGVSDSDADRIFSPFFTTSRAEGGTGLGLSIVQTLVCAHGGTVEVHTENEGGCFLLRLPA